MRISPSAVARGLFLAVSFSASLGASAASAASDIEDACTIFQERSEWRGATHAASQKWRVPVAAILAVMRQESGFVATAAARTSSARGFAQVLDGTWNWYREATRASGAKRGNFADSADFIGWYMATAEKRIGLPTDDVASHYLVYHEGHVGYRSFRWEKKPGLIELSEKVARIAARYERQLAECVLEAAAETAPSYSRRPLTKPFALASIPAVTPKTKPADRLVAQAIVAASWRTR